MKKCLFASLFSHLFFTSLCAHATPSESISSFDNTYKEACVKIANDPWYFEHFRSLDAYTHIVETGGGKEFADYLWAHASKTIWNKFSIFEKLDHIGAPVKTSYPGIGMFSATTLRYIVIAQQMEHLFTLPDHPTVVEIGAGFGGQCYILSQLVSFSHYYIYDLPEVSLVIDKVLTALCVNNATCLPLDQNITEENIDLVISNYAFSECTRETQLDYFNRVIKKSLRGYMIYNQIASSVFGLDSLSPQEFVSLLKQSGKNPKIYQEPVQTYPGNLLIVWDTTTKTDSYETNNTNHNK